MQDIEKFDVNTDAIPNALKKYVFYIKQKLGSYIQHVIDDF